MARQMCWKNLYRPTTNKFLNYAKILQLISITSILIPIGIGMMKYKIAGLTFRLFLLFLVIGFANDITMYSLLALHHDAYLPAFFSIYSLIESIFFFWVIEQGASSKRLKQISRLALILIPAYGLLAGILYPLTGWPGTPGEWFDTLYEVAVAFLSGFLLLQWVEKEVEVFSIPLFWIVLGIFFYCFSTFFIMGFLKTVVSRQIWFLNNSINILTYLFYTLGLYKIQNPPAKQNVN
jgi:hypothetical protein